MKKAILLAMVGAIVGLFAVPGSASAAWTKHHEPITQNEEVEVTLTDWAFTGGVGGITCHALIATAVFEAGTTTGTIKTFKTHPPARCTPTGGLAHCTFNAFQADPTPGGTLVPEMLEWPIHTVSTGTVSITTGDITTDLSGFLCPDIKLTPGTLHLTATTVEGSHNTTSTAHLSGTLTGDPGGNVSISGTVHILGPLTYGF